MEQKGYAVSFGDKADLGTNLDQREDMLQNVDTFTMEEPSKKAHHSVISVTDINEVKDRTPASPATHSRVINNERRSTEKANHFDSENFV